MIYSSLLKFILNPKTIALIIASGLLMIILFLNNQKTNLQKDVIELKNKTEILKSYHQKCTVEKDLIIRDTKQLNKIIMSLRANLKAEQDDCKFLFEKYRKSIVVIKNAKEEPVSPLIKERKLVDEESSSNIIGIINSLF